MKSERTEFYVLNEVSHNPDLNAPDSVMININCNNLLMAVALI